MIRVQVIGDEIHADGELMAIMTTNAAPSARGRFEDAIRDLEIPNGDAEEEAPSSDAHPLDALVERANESAKGGLLRMSDLTRIVRQLKEPT